MPLAERNARQAPSTAPVRASAHIARAVFRAMELVLASNFDDRLVKETA